MLRPRFLDGLGFEQVVFDRSGPDVFQIPGDVVTEGALRWLERYGDEPLAVLLNDFGIRRGMVSKEVITFVPPLLKQLREAGLVSVRRQGTRAFARLPDDSTDDPVLADFSLAPASLGGGDGGTFDLGALSMGGAGMVCQSCHGGMLAVGNPDREPWIDEPRCESCHTGDALDHLGTEIRFSQAWEDGNSTATPRLAANKRFAENPGQLYRNSLGHGGVACEGCHGSTHAIWPNADPNANDNVAAIQLQGHSGSLIECAACHTSR